MIFETICKHYHFIKTLNLCPRLKYIYTDANNSLYGLHNGTYPNATVQTAYNSLDRDFKYSFVFDKFPYSLIFVDSRFIGRLKFW